MALTTPVRDKRSLKRLAEYFLSRGQFRNHLLLAVCAHTALRISDVLCLKWSDVYDFERENYHSHVTLTEAKTGKTKTIALHPKIISALRLYFPLMNGRFIFSNNRGESPPAISRVQAWRILSEAGEALMLGIRLSPHALRKSWGYHSWKGGTSPVVLMHVYNHSSYEVTRRYLGVSQDDTDQAYLAVNLF